MRAVDDRPRVIDAPPPSADVLIEEARRRHRKRRLSIAFTLLLVVIAGAVAVALGAGTPSSTKHPPATALFFGPSTPAVNAKAFAGQGNLAFISRKTLYVLDGTTGTLRRLSLPSGYVASAPAFSHDGKWLAFIASRTVSASSEVFSALDDHVWRLTFKWARYSHANKPKRWVVDRYFGQFNKSRQDRWVFGDRNSGVYLLKFSWTKIVRHQLVPGTASPDDPALAEYWSQRR